MKLPNELKQSIRKVWNKKPKLLKTRPEILLCSNIPQPMHGVAPRVILGEKWWNATRQAAYKSTAYRCLACGVSKQDAKMHHWLEGHELYKIDYKKGLMRYVETVPLCHYCHTYIHDGRLNALLEQGRIHHAKFVAIMKHGDAVLAKAGLSRPLIRDRDDAIIDGMLAGEVAPWNKWRLVIKGKRYPPRYKTLNDWRKAYDYD